MSQENWLRVQDMLGYNDLLSVRKNVSSIYTMTYINKFSNDGLNDFCTFILTCPALIKHLNDMLTYVKS